MDRQLLFDYLLSSSSSSSSSESDPESDEDILNLITSKGDKIVKLKITGYVEIVKKYTDKEFKSNFRMKRATYELLKDRFEKSNYYSKEQTHGGNPPISADVAVLSFLWYAGNKSTIRDVAGRFGVAESTFHSLATKVMEFLNEIAPSIIKFPSTLEEKQNSATEFLKLSEFPNVLGCIDGTYIPISTPRNKIKSTYVNRHDTPSITLQGICRYDKLFLDVFTGVPSKIHDSRVYNLSHISKKLPNICEDNWHILGDSAYPLRKWLLTPFRDYGNLTDMQKNYNKRFSATRVKIENAFGLLKSRWRQLIRTDFSTVLRTADFIVSCCVLHNLCIIHNDEWDEEYINDDKDSDNVPLEEVNKAELKRQGEKKRNTICAMLPA